MRYWALASDGYLYDLGDHAGFCEADEATGEVLPRGQFSVWLVSTEEAKQWRDRLTEDLEGL